jgi:hypothetical protein
LTEPIPLRSMQSCRGVCDLSLVAMYPTFSTVRWDARTLKKSQDNAAFGSRITTPIGAGTLTMRAGPAEVF